MRDNKDRDMKKGGMRNKRAKKKVCAFCSDKTESIDYKDINKLRKYVTERGKLLPRRISGNCAKHQRELTAAVKRARNIALLPFTTE
jgi:small subunit ribosomal protein S18